MSMQCFNHSGHSNLLESIRLLTVELLKLKLLPTVQLALW